MSIISIKDVEFSYPSHSQEETLALKDISLEIVEGSFVTIVGHNGSGKSTLAKLLNGLLLPTKGSVEILGNDTADDTKMFEIRSNIGMVFQNPDNQMIASIVEDDIAFGPENLGVERQEIIRRVEWALNKVGMSQHRLSTPFKMSGGQKQRIAIAGVLAMLPKVLVLDEATAMLDPKGRQEVMNVAHELNKKDGITVINITHYMDEAMNTDRVIVMNDARIVADASPAEIFSQYDMLKSIKLCAPMVVELCAKLNKCGASIKPNIFDEEQLVEELCQLL